MREVPQTTEDSIFAPRRRRQEAGSRYDVSYYNNADQFPSRLHLEQVDVLRRNLVQLRSFDRFDVCILKN